MFFLTSGCGRARVVGGGAFSANDEEGYSGLVGGGDILVPLWALPTTSEKEARSPFAFHISGEVLSAENIQNFTLGTGMALYRSPNPLSSYLILGTSMHADRIEGKASVGNMSPYAELGVATLLSDHPKGRLQPIFTLGVTGTLYINYLLLDEHPTTPYYGLKFGFGFDLAPPR